MSDSLELGEVHPATHEAFAYIKALISNPFHLATLKECFASTALSGNRLSEVCLGTLDRLVSSQPVSDRYLLGLAWTLKSMNESDGKNAKTFAKNTRVKLKTPTKGTTRSKTKDI